MKSWLLKVLVAAAIIAPALSLISIFTSIPIAPSVAAANCSGPRGDFTADVCPPGQNKTTPVTPEDVAKYQNFSPAQCQTINDTNERNKCYQIVNPPSVTGDYIDHNHIKVNGSQIFTDKDTDDKPRYEFYNSGACTNPYITVNSGDTSKGTYYKYTYNDLAKDCKKDPGRVISLNFVGKSLVFFNWANAGLIRSSDEKHSFTPFNSADAKPTLPGGKMFSEPGKCITTLEVDPAKPETGLLIVRTSSGNDVFNRGGGYFGYPFSDRGLNANPKDIGGGCVEYDKMVVTIGSTDLATGAASDPNADPAASGKTEPKCDVGAFSWIFCPIITLAQEFIIILQKLVINILETDPLSDGVKAVMMNLTRLTNVLFLIIFIVIIASTTLSIGISNYGVKKMLPRLIVAVIAVQFAFPLIQLMLDITNILGNGISGLISAAVPVTPSSSRDVSAAVGFVEIAGAGAIGFVLLPALIIPVILAVLGALLGLITVYITLFVRAILIQLLAILAPIALAAWVLPNTEKYAKMWWTNFTKLLMMYPIIACLFAVGNIISSLPSVIEGSASGGSEATSMAAKLMASLAPIIVFFMVPKTFKWSGSAMGAVAGKINGYGGKVQKVPNKIAGSKLAKDMRQASREKSAIKSLGSSNSGLKYLHGLRAGGGLIPTAASRRNVAGIAATGEKKRVGDASRLIEDLSSGDINALAQGKDVTGVKADQYSTQAAIAKMAGATNADGLRDVKAALEARGSGGQMSAQDQRAWNQGTQAKYGDLAAAAPDLMSDKGLEAFAGMTAKKLSALKGKSADNYMSYLKDIRSKVNNPATSSTKRDEYKAELENAKQTVIGLSVAPTLKSAVGAEVGKAIRSNAHAIFTDGTDAADIQSKIHSSGAFV